MKHKSFGAQSALSTLACLIGISCSPEQRPLGDPDIIAAWEAAKQDAGRQDSVPAEPTAVTPSEAEPGEELPPLTGGLDPSTMSGAESGESVGPMGSPDAGAACLPTGPRDCSSELDNDCDGLPDNTADDVCVCVPGTIEPCDEHPGLDGRGQCTAGTRTCELVGDGGLATDWGACVGSVGPGEADSCAVAGDDTDCDGTANRGCPCVDGQTQECGPATEDGICQRGVQTCVNAEFGDCVGAVFPAARDCRSTADNDCDGRPDNTIDNACTCTIGAVQACGTHPGDGNGQCRAGSQTCEARANNTTSTFGNCVGSVGPAPADSCAPGNDGNCNGQENEGCACLNGETQPCGVTDVGICAFGVQTCVNGTFAQQCVGAVNPGARNCGSAADNDCDGEPDNTLDNVCECTPGQNGACSGDPENSRCNGQGRCAPCQADADCSLVSGGRTVCDGGECVSPGLPDGEECAAAGDCASGSCDQWFTDADGDGYGVGSAQRLCGTPAGFARTPGDCCDVGGASRAVSASINPGQDGFFSAPQTVCAGVDDFDYDCSGAIADQIGVSVGVAQAGNCGPDCDGSGWVLDIDCGDSGTLVECSLFMGFCSINSNSPTARTEVRSCH